MAANPFENIFTNPPLFDIYNDPVAAARNNVPAWPGGACNYADLTNGAKCGCRRFWTRPVSVNPTPDSAGWCMCNHHACFHDNGNQDGSLPEIQAPPLEQENERPRTGREPLSPMVDLSQNLAAASTGPDFANFGMEDPLSFIYNDPEALGIDYSAQPAPTQQPSGPLPDTLNWNEFVQTNPQAPAPSHINSQPSKQSQATSIASSIHPKYLRPFAGKGLQTLDRPMASVPPAQPDQLSQNSNLRPSAKTSPLGKPERPYSAKKEAAAADSRPGTATQPEPRTVHHEEVTREALQNISDTISGHEQRLDRLETVSFSASTHDECHEKHDHMDLRVTDVEARMDEVEKQTAEYSAVVARFVDKNDDSASQSVASFSTAGTSRPTYSQELYSQIQSLQAQVNSLQSILPSHSHAWEVEVVFLPFALKKLWQEIQHFKPDSGSESDEWTQLQMTYSAKQYSSQSPYDREWAEPRAGLDWLLPKACGDKSIMDKRLRSRGLVKMVSVTGSDARSIQTAIHAAFGDVWREMHLNPAIHPSDSSTSQFMALQSTWVPLRKIHKDSRLRFLSPAEMLTPAMWDVQFLHSVMMRSSEPRLFITHPDAYLQDGRAHETCWSWHSLQRLSPVSLADGQPTNNQLENLHEDYWAFNAQLDEPRQVQSSFVKQRGDRSRTSTSSPLQQHFPPIEPHRSYSPTVSAPPQPLRVVGRKGSRPPHIRTSSMPVPAQSQHSPALSRRIVSGGQSRRSSPSVRNGPGFAIIKRRQTRSPSYHRFTPRWTASPSPMPMGATDRHSAQPTTPFAYATPFSNAPLQEFPQARGSSAVPVPVYHNNDDEGDELYDVEFYDQSDSEQSEEGSDSTGSGELVTHDAQVDARHDSQHWQFPEDEPWPGIEDRQQLSDGENINPKEADRCSDASSQPSEYPSTQSAWPKHDDSEFHIHEDDD